MIRRYFSALVLTGLFLSLIACGGPGGPIDKGFGNTPLNVNIGDAPTDRIAAFALTINSVVLSGPGVTTTVLGTPTQVEFAHISGTVAPLSLSTASNVAYTTATITVSSPQVTIINDAGAPVAATASLSQTSFEAPFSAQFNSAASTLNIDLNVAQSVTLNLGVNPPTATVAPIFTARVTTNVASSTTPELGGFQEVTGAVTGTTTTSFTISASQTGQSLTFNADNSTVFNGVSGISALQNGFVVEVNGGTRSDGTLLATSVTLQVGIAVGLEVEGLVTSVTGKPATSLDVVVRDEATTSASKPVPGAVVTANVSAVPANNYLVNSSADLTGVTVPFDASHVALGQSLELDAPTAAVNNLATSKVQLRDGTWSGTITGAIIPLGNGGTQFTITLPSDSALAKLAGVTTVTVIRQPSTALLNGVTITTGQAVRVRGPLFFDGASYTQVAVRMTTP